MPWGSTPAPHLGPLQSRLLHELPSPKGQRVYSEKAVVFTTYRNIHASITVGFFSTLTPRGDSW